MGKGKPIGSNEGSQARGRRRKVNRSAADRIERQPASARHVLPEVVGLPNIRSGLTEFQSFFKVSWRVAASVPSGCCFAVRCLRSKDEGQEHICV